MTGTIVGFDGGRLRVDQSKGSRVFPQFSNARVVRYCFVHAELCIEDATVGDGVRRHR